MVLMTKNDTTARKKTLGRQKIEIKKLENNNSKQVTFSKRRSGLFKKSGELTVLCGADVAAIVFSPSNKIFCFGYPDIDSVLNNYLYGTSSSSLSSSSAARRELVTSEFNRVYRETTKELEVVKRRAEEMKQASSVTVQIASEKEKNTKMQISWWEEKGGVHIGIGSSEDSEHYIAQLKEMRRKVANRLEELMGTSATTTPFHGGNLGVVSGGSRVRNFGFVFGAGRRF
ncbi:hypothetical protein FNV43_RR10790 [Rhamnella rubrinervis]|uniref:MADS-box domain-containing protein n=1 Tax=Rhamnella rubrinervis TaxID=2594499 RepID=A0A8K0H4R3_9ROSA|nr:hypothetical protein FNV43_RR10790 [Rhamnella rubrinervis]